MFRYTTKEEIIGICYQHATLNVAIVFVFTSAGIRSEVSYWQFYSYIENANQIQHLEF